MLSAAIAGCASGPPKPYVMPDTAIGKLKTLAFLPFYGGPVAADVQEEVAGKWADWWREIYRGVTWIKPSAAAGAMVQANALPTWTDGEKLFTQTGLIPPASISAMCAALGADALLQMHVHSLQAGTTPALISRVLSWPFGSYGTPSTSAVSVSIVRCSNSETVWRASAELAWKGDYTQAQMVEYVVSAAFQKLPQ